MLPALFVVALMAGGSTESPLQLCTGDSVRMGRGYDMRAVGNARCILDDIQLVGGEAEVSGNDDRSRIRFVVSGSAQVAHAHGTMGADRITVDMAQAGRGWQVRRVLLEYTSVQFVPAEPGG